MGPITPPGSVTEGIVEGTAPLSEEERRQQRELSLSPGQAAQRRFLRDTRAVICLVIILVFAIGSFVFPPIYQRLGPSILGGPLGNQKIYPEQYHHPFFNNLEAVDQAPYLFQRGKNWSVYPLGTDGNGRDELGVLMSSLNVSILIALSVEVFDIVLGLLFGTLAGFFVGWIDTVLARFTDVVFAFPGLLLIILIGATLGPIFDEHFPGAIARPLLIVLAIGLLVWPLMMRQVRGQSLTLKEQQYVEAARTVGTGNAGIILRHLIPNLLSVVVIIATLNVLGTITTEAAISLLGVGIQPPAQSLGLMISDGIGQVDTNAAELIVPGAMLVLLVVCFAFVGDGVNDAFNPRATS
jgi:ABC-type dipeptide/oligopeptide/nickel transport system permease subunit